MGTQEKTDRQKKTQFGRLFIRHKSKCGHNRLRWHACPGTDIGHSAGDIATAMSNKIVKIFEVKIPNTFSNFRSMYVRRCSEK